MNNFNAVFTEVKKQCASTEEITGNRYFEDISRDSNVPMSRLDFYLDTLASVGLIKYSIDNWYIQLTPYGRVKERIFAD